MRPGGRDVPRLHTGNGPPPRNALLQERCTRSPALRPREIVSPRRPLDFGCGRIGPSTLQSTYPQGIIPRKDDPPRFGCSPPTAGGTARTPAKCTPPHRLRTATDPATKAKNTGTARTHPNRALSHHPAAPRMPNPSAAGYGGRRRASFAWKAEGHPCPAAIRAAPPPFPAHLFRTFKIGDKNILKKSLLCNTNYIRLYIYICSVK